MSAKTLTRSDLAEAVCAGANISRRDAGAFLDTMIEEMVTVLARGEDVKISRFASFCVRTRRQRVGRNPRTGQEVPIPPRRVLSFRPGAQLRKQVNSTNQ
ncbi:MAG: integration host factor subunit alpha [Pseudomonadota bacterium]|nr:integration host factor subunit alpha [Pseudomonadota bacterium]